MRFHDGAANAKSHTGAVGFGSKESIEDLVRLLRGKPYTGVTDRDQKLLVFRSLRPDGELPRPILVLHRFDRSEERRVGKECRSRRSPAQYDEKETRRTRLHSTQKR